MEPQYRPYQEAIDTEDKCQKGPLVCLTSFNSCIELIPLYPYLLWILSKACLTFPYTVQFYLLVVCLSFECLNQFHKQMLIALSVWVRSISVHRVLAVCKPYCSEGWPWNLKEDKGNQLTFHFHKLFLLVWEALWKKVGPQMYTQALTTMGKVHSGNLNTWQMHLSTEPLRLPPAANYNYFLLSW